MEVVVSRVVQEFANGGKKVTTIYQDTETKKLRYETKEEGGGGTPTGATGFYVQGDKI